MFCKKCGTEVTGEFCPNCGAKIEDNIPNDEQKTEGREERKQITISLDQLNLKLLYKIIEGVGAAIVLFGCILPLYSISILGTTMSQNYIKGDGLIVMALLAVTLVLSFIGIQKAAPIPLILAIACFVYDVIHAGKLLDGLGTFGAGLYFIIFGFIIMAAGLFVAIKNKFYRNEITKELTPEERKKRNTIIAVSAGAGVVVIAVVCVIMFTVVKPQKEYDAAVSLLEYGSYDEAIEAFEKLGNYKDSTEKISECKYQKAKDKFDFWNYDEAAKLFQEIPDYKDSADKLKECKYLQAKQTLDDDEYDKAAEMFQSISDYKDAADMVKECKYQKAEAYFYEEDYQKTIDVLKQIKDYKDASEVIANCEYLLNPEPEYVEPDYNTSSSYAQTEFWIPDEEDMRYVAYSGRYVNDYGEELGISMYTSLDEGSTVGLVSYDNCEGKLVDVGDGWYMINETGSDYDGWRLSGYITADGKISMTMFYYNDYTGTYSFYCDFTMVEQYVS